MDLRATFPFRSLATRLLFFTVLFVLLAEAVVLIPSVSKRRVEWFDARVQAAYLVSIALEGPRGQVITEEDAKMMFDTAGIRGVTAKRGDVRVLILSPEIDPHGSQKIHRVDMDNLNPVSLIANAWATMISSGEALIQLTWRMDGSDANSMDIVVSQRDLRHDLHAYARNILILSLVISSMAAALLFYVFNRMIVHPVTRLTDSMAAFEADPDRATLIHVPSERDDEIGGAERSLSMMQQRINELLSERRRLAALGAGISKISHDLRNILASAQLMSDRLAKSDDPAVRKLSPRLISALDRAIALSRDTISFGGMEPRKLHKTAFNLRDLVEEVYEDTASIYVDAQNDIDSDLYIRADRTQLYRCLFNLARNAVEAIAPTNGVQTNGAPTHSTEATSATPVGQISISAEPVGADGDLAINVADTGPGIPDHARGELFEPFKGSQKPGGSGLGLAIAAEIARAHGGEMTLAQTGEKGTAFRISLPGAIAQSDASTTPVSQTPSLRGSAAPS